MAFTSLAVRWILMLVYSKDSIAEHGVAIQEVKTDSFLQAALMFEMLLALPFPEERKVAVSFCVLWLQYRAAVLKFTILFMN